MAKLDKKSEFWEKVYASFDIKNFKEKSTCTPIIEERDSLILLQSARRSQKRGKYHKAISIYQEILEKYPETEGAFIAKYYLDALPRRRKNVKL
ncbi:hypothetical protein D6745_03040 [Candidatus Woesearchaeota archaeon]|nr:MAG: hypothetical protein D6745_03040 [Candidatus Woesearchaeota archaeon]